MRLFYLLSLLFFLTQELNAQKVLQIEKFGSPYSQKIYIGEEITYLIKDDDVWHKGYITDLLVDREVIALEDRYINMNEVEAFRYQRGWTKPASISLVTFGVAWSSFALIGTATDGDPTTSYRSSDAIVSAVSIGLGVLVGTLLKRKVVKFGKRRRLRMLDLSFKKPGTF